LNACRKEVILDSSAQVQGISRLRGSSLISI
jgi:hypothetical protein